VTLRFYIAITAQTPFVREIAYVSHQQFTTSCRLRRKGRAIRSAQGRGDADHSGDRFRTLGRAYVVLEVVRTGHARHRLAAGRDGWFSACPMQPRKPRWLRHRKAMLIKESPNIEFYR
jgi:hypothetical protein